MKKTMKIKALSLGVAFLAAVTATPAFNVLADSVYGTGKITIKASAANTDGHSNDAVTYKGYQILKAKVSDSHAEGNTTGKEEVDPEWVSLEVGDAVQKLIKKEDSTYKGTTAENAADFITGKITGTDSNSAVEADSFAQKLAETVSSLTETTTLTPGKQSEPLTEGYWLFITDKNTTDDKTDLTGTAPIFAVVGGSDVTVTEKTAIPTVDKKVRSKEKDDFAPAADAPLGQNLEYQLTGTLPSNIASFTHYAYTFTDTFPEAMTVEPDTISVYAENGRTKTELRPAEEKASGYVVTRSENAHELRIDFADLKKAKAKDSNQRPTINKETKIIVTYRAKLDPSKKDRIVYGGKGNRNSVTLTYQNNPFSEGKGVSTAKSTAQYAYQLKLHKIDRLSEKSLAGAKFTIEKADADSSATGNYLETDGTLGSRRHEFTTDENGTILVQGLGTGKYIVKETAAPQGYDNSLEKGFTFEIRAGYRGQDLERLENRLITSTPDAIVGSTDGDTRDNALNPGGKNDGADKATGTVLITAADKKKTSIGFSGQSGITVYLMIGAGVLAVSLVAYEKNRKKKAERE